MKLMELGVVRVSTEDTAGAAQVTVLKSHASPFGVILNYWCYYDFITIILRIDCRLKWSKRSWSCCKFKSSRDLWTRHSCWENPGNACFSGNTEEFALFGAHVIVNHLLRILVSLFSNIFCSNSVIGHLLLEISRITMLPRSFNAPTLRYRRITPRHY